MKTSDFHYELPEDRIAQTPVAPRDSARLLVGNDLSDHAVRDLPDLLSPGDLVVMNNTKVRAARLRGRRVDTGGAVELLLLGPKGANWEALVRPARRLRAGLEIDLGTLRSRIETDPIAGQVEVSLHAGDGDVEASIEAAGEMPLPPYIHERLEDPDRYQTVYADRVGSAAAPTAGLHLTEATLDAFAERGIATGTVELQVGLDTFRPITVDDIAEHEMHSEIISVPPETVDAVVACRERGGRVVAIGTTTVRALESAASDGRLKPFEGPTKLYITPGYRFRVVDSLLTNFHIPGSSLLVMIASFVGERWREIYETALQRQYRFLSFGDAMLLERADSDPGRIDA